MDENYNARGGIAAMFALFIFSFVLFYVLADAITDPAYQDGLTARYQSQQQTRQVQAREWGETARAWSETAQTGLVWGGGALAVLFAVGGSAWAVVRWQEERTKRHTVSAQQAIVLAYIAQFGGRAGLLNGVEGVYLDASGEFVPWQVARAELPAAALLSLR